MRSVRPSVRFGTVALVAALAGCSPVRLIESVNLLTALSESAERARDEEGPVRREIVYVRDDRQRRADLYVPSSGAEAALVLVPGAAEEGRRDPRLIGFAGDLVDAGFLVLVPQLAGDSPLRVSTADAEAIADSVVYLTEIAGVHEVGLAGISYAVGPTVLAALHPEVAPRVRFILAVGGYHDVIAAITYLTTGAYRPEPDQPWRQGPVYADAKWLFLLANADRLDPPDDRLLATLARRRLNRPAAPVSRLVSRLGPDGRAVYRLLANDDPERVPALVADLPDALRRQVYGLDLARRDLHRLEAELLLVHGRDDPMVPYTESVDLARAVGSEQARLFIVDDLRHVDLGVPALDDALTLVRAAYQLLLQRDRAPEPGLPATLARRTGAGRCNLDKGLGQRTGRRARQARAAAGSRAGGSSRNILVTAASSAGAV